MFFRNSFYVEGIAAVVLGSVTCKLAEDGFKLATRWLTMELSWPPDGSKSLQDGFKLSLFCLGTISVVLKYARAYARNTRLFYFAASWLYVAFKATPRPPKNHFASSPKDPRMP